ncbi:MAG: 2-C-methyl-D-erythritol 4-phosphate cytidylyltransferase [Tissierellia bacterium]|nr:2-C-methyl-D-erythritol 4-phosphate cytidylyltransferase [Tissierellia bacterium]
MSRPYTTVLIAAAGLGARMQLGKNKQFLEIDKVPMVIHTLEKFDSLDCVDHIILLIRREDREEMRGLLDAHPFQHEIQLVLGGVERQDSIYNGLMAMPRETELVITHDGARPFVRRERILEILAAAEEYGACCLVSPMIDTVKISDDGIWSRLTPDRSKLFAVQTPQGFHREVILEAYHQAFSEGYYGTDDCSLVEKTGRSVRLVPGDFTNIKVTTPEDIIFAKAIYGGDQPCA